MSWIHHDIFLSSKGGRFHYVLWYVEAIHQSGVFLMLVHISSEHIKPRPLCLPFLLCHWLVLSGARNDHMANEQ